MRNYDTEVIQLILLFESLTNVPVKDCVVDKTRNLTYFIVEEGKASLAVGKNGSRVKKLEKLTGKTIQVVEFSEDLEQFVANLMPVLHVKQVLNKGEKVVEVRVPLAKKGHVLGRDRRNLKIYEEILRRTHHVNRLIVK